MDKTYNVHEAKTHLSELLERAQAGEEIVIAKANKPIAKLVALTPPRPKKRIAGLNAGEISHIADDFDAPLPDAFWEGNPDSPLNRWLDEQRKRKHKRPRARRR